MKWPRQVTVRGERWTIRLVGRNALPRPPKGKVMLGSCDPSAQEICIWQGLKGKARWVVLLHELMHLAFNQSCGEDLAASVEHALIDKIEEPLFDILHGNFGFGED